MPVSSGKCNYNGVEIFKKDGYPLALDICGEFLLCVKNTSTELTLEKAMTYHAVRLHPTSQDNIVYRIPTVDEWKLIEKYMREIQDKMEYLRANTRTVFPVDEILLDEMWALKGYDTCCASFGLDYKIRFRECSPYSRITLREIFDICQ